MSESVSEREKERERCGVGSTVDMSTCKRNLSTTQGSSFGPYGLRLPLLKAKAPILQLDIYAEYLLKQKNMTMTVNDQCIIEFIPQLYQSNCLMLNTYKNIIT